MAITKLATGEKRIAMFQQLRCSSTWARGIHEDLIYLSVFNIFLSIAAVLGNTLILMALRKVFSLHLPSKLLFRCLATTDLCDGLITKPHNVIYSVSVAQEEWNLCHYKLSTLVITGYISCSVFLLTVTAISMDRLLALLLGLRHLKHNSLHRF